MSRPLLVTDCDEVLLHMISHFADWLREAHALDFDLDEADWPRSLRDSASGEIVALDRALHLLDLFFDSEMHRQKAIPGAAEALAEIGRHADIVVLTNIGHRYQAGRVEQLGRFEIHHRVLCNSGGKGRPVAALIDELQPSATVFVDDRASQIESVAKHAPRAWRLHMVGEPRVAVHTPTPGQAHARIDAWEEAVGWILARFAEGPAPA